MISYKDIFTDLEMITDDYKMRLVDDVIYEVDCKLINIYNGSQLHDPVDSDEDNENVIEVNDVIHNFDLSGEIELTDGRQAFMELFRGYMRKVQKDLKDNKPEELETFRNGSNKYLSHKVGPSINNFRFYLSLFTNETDTMPVMVKHLDDGTPLYACFWKHGLYEEEK
ncbi:Translationally-controlled tumor protein [Wickerhamomyces ciferrii]|uniref:Translationally-controlled tumor protein homolog n=1 Tax=Wickerhamomyces ciferrii (strain ATCC 14091 / BCRC 22168 / CBS 111 / JCM 3599 / NBRC 0793 / NRRL Y-1031 F-60-10) TaxID=1206466 RepID=K0KNZ8_WICCF|nr:Translationally-controlled tumor protein [Wickerhamomyces ciferrii]CCH42828.1 Translationally-controlled tumor protein [Wickerhamomyces ciferrii]